MTLRKTVIYTDEDALYHEDCACPVFQRDHKSSSLTDFRAIGVRKICEPVAVTSGKDACQGCIEKRKYFTPGTAKRVKIDLPEPLWNAGYSVDLLGDYMHNYGGRWVERFEGGGDDPMVANRFTTADVLAVGTLSENIPAKAFLPIFHDHADCLSALLAMIPTTTELSEAPDSLIGPESAAWQLWEHLESSEFPGISSTRVSKLLARKRPRLIPVYDELVRDTLNRPKRNDLWFWHDLRDALRAEDRRLKRFLEQVRNRVGDAAEHLSTIRVFDVIVWMYAQKNKQAGKTS